MAGAGREENVYNTGSGEHIEHIGEHIDHIGEHIDHI
jgi:hypothetical protein